MNADLLKQTIFERLNPTEVFVEDMSGKWPFKLMDYGWLTLCKGGCGQAFAVIIVSTEFQGKNKLMRSRLVNTKLKE